METTLVMMLGVIALWITGILSSEVKTINSRPIRILFMSLGFVLLWTVFFTMGINATGYTVPTGVTVPYVSANTIHNQAVMYDDIAYGVIAAFVLYVVIELILYTLFLMAGKDMDTNTNLYNKEGR